MKITAIVDIVSAVFIAIVYVMNHSNSRRLKSSRYLNTCLMLMLLMLLADAGAYLTAGPAHSLALRFFLNLLSFTGVSVNAIAFIYYMEELFRERGKEKLWAFRAIRIVEYIFFVCCLYEYIAGNLVSYDAGGIETINMDYPGYIIFMSFAVTLALVIAVLANRKYLGKEMTALMAAFTLVPVVNAILYSFVGMDLSYALSALTLVLISEFIQKKLDSEAETEYQKQLEEQQRQLEEALEKAEEEAVLRNMVYELGNTSPWSYEVSAEDEITEASYSDRLVDKINAKPSGNPMGWVDIVHPDDRERVVAGFMAPVYNHSGNTVYDESYRIKDKAGNWHWVRSTGRVIRRKDGSGQFVGMASDFTEQVREREEQQKRLAEALDMADAANQAKTDFLFNMSHDIRTPMNAIIGFTNIAKKEINNPQKALESLEKVQLSSDILLSLINDVLDMSRIESGKAELHEEKHDVQGVFGTIEAAMAGLAANKDIDLQLKVGEVRDRYVFADGPRFDRVIINIISNAIKYTPAGGWVKVTAEQIADTKPGWGNYRFTVADNGIGMSDEFQKHMFEDFAREENSTTSGIQGTGLGLSLAKKLTDMMGGSIACKSSQGIGTTFTLTFPFRLQTAEDIAEGDTPDRKQAQIDLRGRKALLVEDNEMNRDIAEEILSDEGIAVETAVDGQKAVNLVREKGPDYYDFILMDIQMPVMNGYEATKAIRDMMPELKTPIIALSANAFEEDKKKSLEAGMNDHVAKPINVSELMNVLAKFM